MSIQLGKVIRKYRKEKQLTQEEVAQYLGVTAPAVNKWEHGNSCPDISLLAPIARLYGITTDTLLSFQEELTEEEMEQIIEEIREKFKIESYDAVFLWTEKKIKEYPNCEKLIHMAAIILDHYRMICNVPNPEKYDQRIQELYERSLESTDAKLVQNTKFFLFFNFLEKKEYEKAQNYLDGIPKQNVNFKQLQAILLKP